MGAPVTILQNVCLARPEIHKETTVWLRTRHIINLRKVSLVTRSQDDCMLIQRLASNAARYSLDAPGALHDRSPSLDEPATPTPKGKGPRLPQVPRDRDFSSDFSNLTLESSPGGEYGRTGQDGQVPISLDEGRNS